MKGRKNIGSLNDPQPLVDPITFPVRLRLGKEPGPHCICATVEFDLTKGDIVDGVLVTNQVRDDGDMGLTVTAAFTMALVHRATPMMGLVFMALPKRLWKNSTA